MKKIDKYNLEIKDPKVRRELRRLLMEYRRIKIKNKNPLIDPRDMLILDYEKAMKNKKYRVALIHLITLGLDEQHAKDFIKSKKSIRIIN